MKFQIVGTNIIVDPDVSRIIFQISLISLWGRPCLEFTVVSSHSLVLLFLQD